MRRLATLGLAAALWVGTSGCRTTVSMAYSIPKADPARPGDCVTACANRSRAEGRDEYLDCVRDCPGVTSHDGSCSDLAPLPQFDCVDEEHKKFSVGKTVVLAVILGVLVVGAAAAAGAVAVSGSGR